MDPTPIPANLRQPCRELAAPTDGTRATTLRWIVDTIEAHRECSDRHKRLVEALGGIG